MLRWPEARGGCRQSVGTDPTRGPTSLILFFISSPGNLRELNVWIRAFMGQGYISFHWGGGCRDLQANPLVPRAC